MGKRIDITGKSMKSVLQSERECWVCGRRDVLHLHHVCFGTANRKHSDDYGYTVWLCPEHHNSSPRGVHFDRELDLTLKTIAQKHFESHHGTREDWIRLMGRSYL